MPPHVARQDTTLAGYFIPKGKVTHFYYIYDHVYDDEFASALVSRFINYIIDIFKKKSRFINYIIDIFK